jgi:hypothetical protein
VTGDDRTISGGIFFGHDFHCGEVTGEAGARQLVSLLGVVALGHEDELVAGAEVGEGFGYLRKQLDFLFPDGAGETANAFDLVFGDRLGAEALEAVDEGLGEAVEAVTVGEDGFAFNLIKSLTDLSRSVFAMIEKTDEGGNGALEVDVVFPEGVVGIDQEGLAGGKLGHESRISRAWANERNIHWQPNTSEMKCFCWRMAL